MLWSCPLIKDTVVLGNCILPIICCSVDWQKLLEISPLDEVVEIIAWWEQAHPYFFVYTVGVQSIHVDLVIFGIHVNTLMLVCGLLVILLDCGKELDVDTFSPCCWIQLLNKNCYPYFQCANPCPCHHGKSYPHGVGNIQCFCLIKRIVVSWGNVWMKFFLSVAVMFIRKGIMLGWTVHVSFEKI